MRIALVHDYLTQVGGAERVVRSWTRGLRPESISTLVWNPDVVPAPGDVPVFTTALQKVPALRRDPRLALPLLPWYAAKISIPTTSDVALVSSSGFAHNVVAAVPKVVYWHTPARWLYAPEDYRLGLPLPGRMLLRVLRPYLERTDRRGVDTTTLHLCNSTLVRDRLRKAYGVDARLLHPPVEPLSGPPRPPAVDLPDRFFLTVGRQRGYKNTGLILAAAEQAGVTIVSAGGRDNGAARRPSSHISLGTVSDPELKWLYAHAEALVSASREDFGLTPLEANLEGTPALVAEAGGFLDSVRAGVNGAFFAPESVEACAAAMRTFRKDDFDGAACRTHAQENFSLERHLRVLRETLERACGTTGNLISEL